jgi:monoamine oxidase
MQPLPPLVGGQRRVAIIGAGVAGLAAACQLEEAGNEVTVFEARARCGGRALTLRDEFEGDVYADAGAARVRDDHQFVVALVARLGLELRPFFPSRGDFAAYEGDQCVARHPAAPRLWSAGRPPRVPASLMPLLDLHGEIAAEARLMSTERAWHRPEYYRISGGTDRLPLALAARFRGRIRYDTAVVRVAQLAEAVEVTTQCRGIPTTKRVDHVICAIPASVLGRVDFSPRLSADKTKAVGALRYASALRVFLQLDRRPWERLRLNGFGISDEIGELSCENFDAPELASMVVCSAKASLARKLGAMRVDERIAYVIARLERIVGGVKGHVRAASTMFWDDSEWSRGAWPAFRENRDSFAQDAILGELRRPEGRIHFAGDHTARDQFGTLDGAIESGYRAAEEVHRSALRVSREMRTVRIEELTAAGDRGSA